MSTTVTPRFYVDVPAPPRQPGGIESAARVIDIAGPPLLGAEYETDACVEGKTWPFPPCGDAAQTAKVFDWLRSLVQGDPIVTYAGVECDLQRPEESQRQAELRLSYTEGAQVDVGVHAWLEANADDMSGAVPLQVGHAISVLEAFGRLIYGGPLNIIVPMALIGCACPDKGVMPGPGGTLVTCSGSRVVPLITADPLADPASIYATGQITLLRGPVGSYVARPSLSGNVALNDSRALAERIYVPLIECPLIKTDVTCP